MKEEALSQSTLSSLTGRDSHYRYYYSFVNHLMMFNKIKLLKLKSEIERKTKCKWYDAIIQEAKKTKEISF